MDRSPVTVDDLGLVIGTATNALTQVADRDWAANARGLNFSCWEAVEHMADDLFAYATQLSGTIVGGTELRDSFAPIGYTQRSEHGPLLTIWADPASGNGGLVQVLASMGGLAVATFRACSAAARGWHRSGLSDAAGFAAMSIVELLAHLDDVLAVFDARITPPQDVCERVIHRLFPDVVEQLTRSEPWPVLLWATGRGALPGSPQRNDWSWDSTVR